MRLDILKTSADDADLVETVSRACSDETPLLVSEMPTPNGDLLAALWAIAHGENTKRNTGHIATALESVNDNLEVPAPLANWISEIYQLPSVVAKPLPVKLWMQPQYHTTHLHYDGNSLNGINWQLAGEKRWLLVSPHTPPPFAPLSQVGRNRSDYRPDPQETDFIEVVTQPGDVLFVPRYWSHEVKALEPVNANVNWVWTPTEPNRKNIVGTRESAVLAIRSHLGRLNKYVPYAVDIRNYGGSERDILDNYKGDLSSITVLKTLLLEVWNSVLFLLSRKQIARRMSEMPSNNFSNLGMRSSDG